MDQGKSFFTIVSIVLVGVVLQFGLATLEVTTREKSPVHTAIAFTKAYYALDADMGDYLCSEYTENEEMDAVDEYLHQVSLDAKAMGFDTGFMRSQLFHVQAEIIERSESEAIIHVTGNRKRNINPVYTIVGKLFILGETYPVDEILNLVKEDGKWKICGKAFSLTV